MLEVKDSKNYAALVIRVPEPYKMPNSDRLFGVSVAGSTVIVNDSWKDRVGELAVVFPAESQISDGLAGWANLFRHSELNRDPEEQGYLEDSRRVRAMRLRGNISNGLMLPLMEVIGYAGMAKVGEGDIFDTINGVEVCRKYVIKAEPVQGNRVEKKLAKAFKRVDEKLFPIHIDTDQYLRNEGILDDDDRLIVTQKLHGSSVRMANVPVKVKHKWYEKLAARLGVRIPEWEFATIAGSRKVTKDPSNPNQKHFYGEGNDIWTEALNRWGQSIPKGVIVYGELVGFTLTGQAIQKGFTYEEYDVDGGTMELYVYRVSIINEDGVMHDMSWDQLRGFCDARGLKHTPELWRGRKLDFKLSYVAEKNFREFYDNSLPLPSYSDRPVALSAGGTGKDEGVVIRVDRTGQVPLLFKYKNDSFFLYETSEIDKGEQDIESSQS